MCIFDSGIQDNKGYTALTIACQNGYADLAMVLLNKGAAVDSKTKVSSNFST
jgi:ankyrin repeat protein